jgi:hypothetical protein
MNFLVSALSAFLLADTSNLSLFPHDNILILFGMVVSLFKNDSSSSDFLENRD